MTNYYYAFLIAGVVLILLFSVLAAWLTSKQNAEDLFKGPAEVRIYPDFKPALGPLVADRRRPLWIRHLNRLGFFAIGIVVIVPMILYGLFSAFYYITTGKSLVPPIDEAAEAARVKSELEQFSIRARARMMEARKAAVFERVLIENCQRAREDRRDMWNWLSSPRTPEVNEIWAKHRRINQADRDALMEKFRQETSHA